MTTFEMSVRERYNARDPRNENGDLRIWLRQELQTIQRGIPWNSHVIDMRDALQPGRDLEEALTKAMRALPDTGGVIHFPTMKAAWLLDGNGATLAAPKRGVTITKNNVWIVGDGDTPIHMANWDQTDAASAGADTAAQDVFTLFRFASGVVGGGVYGFYVTGESDDSALSVGEPRAKVVGCDGAHHIRIACVRGVDIVGNVLNARGENSGAGAAGECRDIWAADVYAENCAENGINYMGGTYDCKVIGGAADDCEFQGLETGTYGVEVVGFRATGNKNGISHVGRYGKFVGCQLNGNTITGFNFQHNSSTFDSAHNVLSGIFAYENGSIGILANSDSHDNELANCWTWDNGDEDGEGEGIKISTDCSAFDIHGGRMYDSGVGFQRYGIDVVNALRTAVRDVRTFDNLNFGLLVQSSTSGDTDDFVLSCNNFEDAVSVSTNTTNFRELAASRGFAQANPAQITSDQNNYNPSWAKTWRLTSDAARTITGIANGVQDRFLRIVNAGAQNIVLANQHASSNAVNRIITGTGADVTLAADDVALLWYDDATDRWRLTNTH